jgi:hypothetical protein
MEGAQPHEIGAALFKLNKAPDDVDDVGAGNQLLDKGLRYRHRAIVEVGF